ACPGNPWCSFTMDARIKSGHDSEWKLNVRVRTPGHQDIRNTEMTDRVLILDFGSQVTQLIARRVREAGVYCEIWPFSADPQAIADFAPKAIILSGGPASVTATDTPRAPQIVFELDVPVLGIC